MQEAPVERKTGLIQEVLLILAGHSSQLEQEDILLELSNSTSCLHPASIKSLTRLIQISSLYNQLNSFAQRVTRIHSTQDTLPSPSISAFGSCLLLELSIYQNLLIDLEFRLLSHHPSLVPADLNLSPSPPLSALLAELLEWHSIFQALVNLINQLDHQTTHSISSPHLIQLIYHHSLTGSPHLAEILTRLQTSVEQVWIDGFRSFVLYGHAPLESSSSNPSQLPLDDLFFAHRTLLTPGLSPSYQPIRFSFREDGLPNLPVLDPIDQLHESIQEICHALSILNHLIQPNHVKSFQSNSKFHSHHRVHPPFNKIPLPTDLQYQLRKSLSPIDRLSHPGFRTAIKNIQEILSSYLFSTHLTPDILSTTLRTLTDVFLLRHSTFARNLVEGFTRLKSNRLGGGGSGLMSMGMDDDPRLSRVRKLISLGERELDVILIKAGISTELGEEPTARKINLEGFSFRFLKLKEDQDQKERAKKGSDQEEIQNEKNQINQSTKLLIDRTFSKLILSPSHPVLLTYSPQPGLSLFLTNEVCSSYSKINSCLFSFLITKQRFKDCWRELTQRERLRTRWLREGNGEESIKFTRLAFEGLRRMSWFIDLMVTYFFHDVIDKSVDLLSKEINYQYQSSNDSETQPQQQQQQQASSVKLGPNSHDSFNNDNDNDIQDFDNDNQPGSMKESSTNFFKSHKMFLVLIEIGLGLKNPRSETIMKSLLTCCFEFLMKVENWSFDLIPNLLSSLDLNPMIFTDSEKENKNGADISMKIKERGDHLIQSIVTFNQLLNQFIIELRKDDFDSTFNLSSSSAKTSSQVHDLDHLSNHNFDDSFSFNSDNSAFFLKASIFRRKSLDSLLLNFDFNHWFSSFTPPV